MCAGSASAARAESWRRRSGQRQPGVRPIWQPTLPGPLAGDGQHGRSALQQGCRLLPEAATCFESENDEAAAARTRRARKLRVGLRRAALSSAQPGWTSAREYGPPARKTGQTMVAPMTVWEQCHSGRPLATTAIRHPSANGTSMFMLLIRTVWATRAPASRHTRATAGSSGRALGASDCMANQVCLGPSA